MKRGLLFDLIGTLLVASSKSLPPSLHAQFLEHGLACPEESFTTAWETEPSLPSETGHTPFEERIARVADRLNWSLNWRQVSRMADDICGVAAVALSVDRDVAPLFGTLRGAIPLGLVTNFDHPRAIYRLLADTGLADAFTTVVISGEIGIWKPDPRILAAALDSLSLQASECLFVGDSLVDVDAAISAGVDPVLIVRDGDLVDPFKSREGSIESRFQSLIAQKKLRVVRSLSKVRELL